MKKENWYILIASILFVTLVINVLSLFNNSAWKLEELKVGWPENMKIVKELYESPDYISQQTTAIDQALEQIKMLDDMWDDVDDLDLDDMDIESDDVEDDILADWNDSNSGVDQEVLDKVSEIKNSWVIHGNKNARFTILEYSELLCPYCKKQSDQWTIDSIMEKYPNEVNTMFRNFIVHSQASELAEVIECVGELSSNKQHSFIKTAFANEDGLTVDTLISIAWDLWLSEEKLKSCIEIEKHKDEITKQTSEWRNLFGINWTPGNVIIDNENGEFVVIPWAYPAEKFIEEIEKLKNK